MGATVVDDANEGLTHFSTAFENEHSVPGKARRERERERDRRTERDHAQMEDEERERKSDHAGKRMREHHGGGRSADARMKSDRETREHDRH